MSHHAQRERGKRRILVDYIKAEHRQKRGGGVEHIALSDATLIYTERSAELLALDEALGQLKRQDVRLSQIVEMLFFGGYSMKEAEALRVRQVVAAVGGVRLGEPRQLVLVPAEHRLVAAGRLR